MKTEIKVQIKGKVDQTCATAANRCTKCSCLISAHSMPMKGKGTNMQCKVHANCHDYVPKCPELPVSCLPDPKKEAKKHA